MDKTPVYYEKYKKMLEEHGFQVGEYIKINFGIQFNIMHSNNKALIRIYAGKKGIRTDLSQIKDKQMVEMVQNCLQGGNVHEDNSSEVGETADNGVSGRTPDPCELIGTDESGKGDYFGPLVIAGVYVNSENSYKLRSLGVDDSKKLSDKQISMMAPEIRKMCPYSTVIIGNSKYNEMYGQIKNLNKLLAWGHARVIENVLEKVDCKFALSDQFGDPSLIENALMERGRKITLMQRPRAEENVAVAAASILARYEFVLKMAQMDDEYGMEFPKGASSIIIDTGRDFVKQFGIENLKNVAKLNFKTTEQIFENAQKLKGSD